jgi:hypothetical protein
VGGIAAGVDQSLRVGVGVPDQEDLVDEAALRAAAGQGAGQSQEESPEHVVA